MKNTIERSLRLPIGDRLRTILPNYRSRGDGPRYGLYEDVRTLSEQGVGIRAIARQLKVCRQVIRRFLQAEEFPEIAPSRREPKGSILDQYKPYIFQRWQQGCRNSVQLYDEIKACGYAGSTSLLRNFLASVRKKHGEAGSAEVLTFDACTHH